MEQFIRTHAGSFVVGIAFLACSIFFGIELYQAKMTLATVQAEQNRRSGVLLPLPEAVEKNREQLLRLETKLDNLTLPCIKK